MSPAHAVELVFRRVDVNNTTTTQERRGREATRGDTAAMPPATRAADYTSMIVIVAAHAHARPERRLRKAEAELKSRKWSIGPFDMPAGPRMMPREKYLYGARFFVSTPARVYVIGYCS